MLYVLVIMILQNMMIAMTTTKLEMKRTDDDYGDDADYGDGVDVD